jgi:PIN domain nuclease of toxin-antitoxin system
VRVLLDTQLLLWSLADATRLPTKARQIIDAAEVYVSAVSIWEIAIKVSLGKLKADPHQVLSALEPTGFLSLPISGEHCACVMDLPPLHRDPFDRLLIAQATTEPMRFVTADASLGAYGDLVTVV